MSGWFLREIRRPPEREDGFYRWRVLWRVIAETEAELGSLPMVLVTPVVAAIFATVVAVSAPAEHVEKGVVQGPGLSAALGLAVVGALGGTFAVVLGVALFKLGRYRLVGDPVWELVRVAAEKELVLELRVRGAWPTSFSSLGENMGLLKSPEPDWFQTGRHGSAARRINPEGVVWRIRVTGAGTYEVRWYAAPDGQRLLELARCTFELGERRVVVKGDNVVFVRPDGSELEVPYEGELLAADQETERVAVLDSTDSIAILSTTPPVTLDDDLQLNQFLVGPAYQKALMNLQAARRTKASGPQPD